MGDHHFRWARFFSRLVFSCFDLPLQIQGRELVQDLAPGAVVIVSGGAVRAPSPGAGGEARAPAPLLAPRPPEGGGSLLELMAIWAAFPHLVRFVLPVDCFRNTLAGHLLRRMGNIPLLPGRDGRGLVRQARGLFRHGGHVGVFWPDPAAGLASPSLQLAARVIRRARCPMVPVALFGAPQALPEGAWVPTVGTIRVRIGAPQRWAVEPGCRPGTEVRQLAEILRSTVATLADPLAETGTPAATGAARLPPFPPESPDQTAGRQEVPPSA